MNERPWPTKLSFRKSQRLLHIAFNDGVSFDIPFELLRVESPSAEVQGHAPNQKKLVAGKSGVGVTEAEPVGRYAVRLSFDDGHNSGIYSWDYLRTLGENAPEMMAEHYRKLTEAGLAAT